MGINHGHHFQRAGGAFHTSLGQRPRYGKDNALEGWRPDPSPQQDSLDGILRHYRYVLVCDPCEMYKLQATRVSAWLDRTDRIEAWKAGTLEADNSFTGSQGIGMATEVEAGETLRVEDLTRLSRGSGICLPESFARIYLMSLGSGIHGTIRWRSGPARLPPEPPFAGDLSPSALKGAVQNSPGREPRGD